MGPSAGLRTARRERSTAPLQCLSPWHKRPCVVCRIIARGLVFFNTNELVVSVLIALIPKSVLAHKSSHVLATASLMAMAALLALVALVAGGVASELLVVVAIVASYFCIALWVLHYAVSPGYFPAEVRGTGFGNCLMCNRVGYIVGPLLGAHLMDVDKALVLVACMTCYLALGALAVVLGGTKAVSY